MVEFERLADDCRVRGEALLPELMAEHDHRRCARPIILGIDRASQTRLHSQPGVIAAGHGLPVDYVRLISDHRS